MKIIDLLNKIAKGEEVPKKLKYNGEVYNEDNMYLVYCALGERCEKDFSPFLNDEVEILEEKKIPEKLKDILRVDDLVPPVDENMYKIWTQTIKNHNKINEICDCLKSKGE